MSRQQQRGPHHVVVGSWDQGAGRTYTRMYEARCDPCRWRTPPTEYLWLARRWVAAHTGSDTPQPPPWVRGPGAA